MQKKSGVFALFTLSSVQLFFFMVTVFEAGSVYAEGFVVEQASVVLKDDVYYLNAQIQVELNKQVMEALDSGVPLTVILEIEICQKRAWLWDEVVTSFKRRYKIKFHALTEQYIVQDLKNDALGAYPTFYSAMRAMRNIENLPIIDKAKLEKNRSNILRLRGRLELDSLPAPLRLNAYLSTRWWLGSDWFEVKF